MLGIGIVPVHWANVVGRTLAPVFHFSFGPTLYCNLPPMDAMTLGQRLAQCLCVGWDVGCRLAEINTPKTQNKQQQYTLNTEQLKANFISKLRLIFVLLRPIRYTLYAIKPHRIGCRLFLQTE